MRLTRASNYRHRITFQKNTSTRGTTGEVVKVWALYATRRASVEPLSGRELFAAQQVQSETSVRIKVRYDDALAAVDVRDYQITFNSKTYDIESVINQFEANKEIHFLCSIHNE